MKNFIFIFFLFLFSLLTIFSSGIIESEDGLLYLSVSRFIYYTGKITAPPYEFTGGENVGKNIHMNVFIGNDGNTYSQTGLGYSFAMVPAVALTDLVYKYFHFSPPTHFPLESDWLILFLASFTNSFFAAALGIVLYLYFVEIKITPKTSILMVLVSLFTTNLFVLSKHAYAHMMFTFFLVLSFYLLKKYSLNKNKILLLISGISYGITAITYNLTFLLPLIPYLIYYFLLLKPDFDSHHIRKTLVDLILFSLGLIPFVIIYQWRQNVIYAPGVIGSLGPIIQQPQGLISNLPFSVVFEGLYGQLLSPGRSIFIYFPLLLIPVIFWQKITRQIKPELIAFIILFIIYIGFYSIQRSFEPQYGKFQILSLGELSWGPRYLTSLIPFGMLIVAYIFTKLKKMQKILIFIPLCLAGLYIQILGIVIPYQTKMHNMVQDVNIAGYHYTMFSYWNYLPQMSPILSTSKRLQNLVKIFPKTIEHGSSNIRFFDGIDFPINVGLERWRAIEGSGYISFENNEPVKNISISIINHPLNTSSESAKINFSLNNHNLSTKPYTLLTGERHTFELNIPETYLQPQNTLIIKPQFDNPKVSSQHLIGLLAFKINNKFGNLESLDIPYIQTLDRDLYPNRYQNWGGSNQNLWKYWNIHTQIFERTPDFWWIRPFYYWDLPKKFFLLLFIINFSVVIYSGYRIFQYIKNIK